MASTLLTTKLHIPKLRPNIVPRPQLFNRLNASLNGSSTLISAPAGFGKTTLVSAWAQRVKRSIAWLSIDEEDNDVIRFLTYLVTAFQQVDTSIGGGILDVLESSQSPPTAQLFTMLINDIAAYGLPSILILDDYHLITNQGIHDAIEFTLNHLPAQMHLVLSTRVDPPIPLARLRAGGQLTEIRSKDLRFTRAEVATFLNDFMGLGLSEENIASLEMRTEGWIASLQLAALSLHGRKDPNEFIATFSGSHQYIIDYLLEEVISRQTEELRTFVFRTSILDRLNGPLCDATLGISTSRKILQKLEESNLFLISMDDIRYWYRYHHLFSDFLRQSLAEIEPDKIPELHRRAARWYEQEGQIPEAVRHSLAAKDYNEASRIVEQNAAQMLEQSELAALMKLVDMLPEEEVCSRPRLCIYHTWALRLSGRPYNVVESRLKDAQCALERRKRVLAKGGTKRATHLLQDEFYELDCHITALYAFQALFREDIPRVIDLALQVQACCPEESFLCSSTANALGWAHRFSGDLEAAIKAFSESTSIAFSSGNIYLAVATQCRAAYAHVLAGKLDRALDSFREAARMAIKEDGRRLPVAGYAYVYLGGIYYERNDLASAARYLIEGIEKCERVGYLMDQAVGCVNLAKLKLAQKDWQGARETLQVAIQLSRQMKGYLYVQRWVEAGQLWLWLAQGNIEQVQHWINECGLSVDDDLSYLRDLEHIILARALVALGRDQPATSYLEEAVSLLARLLEKAEAAGWMGKAIEILALQSIALDAYGKRKEAMTTLERALALAEPGGYERTFIDEGPPMFSLLQEAALNGLSSAFAKKIITAFDTDMVRTEDASHTLALIDPLSTRELEVLRQLATELSGPEIARELTIALPTLRFHTRNIYSKLSVNNRRSAIQRAKELHLM